MNIAGDVSWFIIILMMIHVCVYYVKQFGKQRKVRKPSYTYIRILKINHKNLSAAKVQNTPLILMSESCFDTCCIS